jgi:hypothetical protein
MIRRIPEKYYSTLVGQDFWRSKEEDPGRPQQLIDPVRYAREVLIFFLNDHFTATKRLLFYL